MPSRPPSGMASREFRKMLSRTWVSWSGSAKISGSPSGLWTSSATACLEAVSSTRLSTLRTHSQTEMRLSASVQGRA